MAVILLVVGDKAALTADDTPIRDHLINNHGHSVVLASDEEAEYASPYDGLFISDSCAAATLGTKYATVAKPAITADSGEWTGAWGFATTGAQHGGVTQWTVPTASDLTDGLSGTITVYTAATTQNGVNPSGLAAGATAQATVTGQPTNAPYVTIPAGGALSGGGTAPARRAIFAVRAGSTALLTADGYRLLDGAMRWAYGAGVAVDASPPAGVVHGAAEGESVEALSINLVVDTDPAAATATGAAGGETVSVDLTDPAPAGVVHGAAGGELVSVAVTAAPAPAAVVGSPPGETADAEEPGLPAGGAPFVSLWAVDPATGGLIHLPHVLKVDLSPIRNSGGSFRFTYPAFGKNFEFLHGRLLDDQVAVEVELWVGGSRFNALGGDVLHVEGDDVAEESVWTFTGQFFTHRLSWATVVHDPAQDKGERRFGAATAGTIMRTFLQEAQGRGTLTDLTFATFSTTHDSAGVPWANTVTMKFTPHADGGLLSVLGRLVALGLCEGEVDRDKRFLLYNAGGAGRDLTTRNPPVILRRSKDLLESNRRIDIGASGTDVYGTGAEGIYANAFDASARARWGQQIEKVVDSNQFEDPAALTAFVQSSRESVVLAPMELTHGLVFGTNRPAPVSGFQTNDWLYSDVGRGLERVRVAQWVLSQDLSGISGSVTLNDIIADRVTRLARRLAAMSDGSAVVGTSQPPTAEDTLAPAAPTGVTADSSAYQEGADTVAVLHIGWTAVDTNSDGSAADDIAGYRVEFAYAAEATAWQLGADVSGTTANFGSLTSGVDVLVRVKAYDRNGNTSAPSASVALTTEVDNLAPPVPSAPVVTTRVSILAAEWDGLGSAGEVMPLDLDFVEVHVSAASNFTPDATTYYDRLQPGGGIMPITGRAYGATTFVRLVAVDKTTPTPNRSGPSAQGSAAPQPVVSADIFDGAVGSAKLADLAVTTAKINDLAVNNAKIGDLNAGKITTGTLSALLTLSGIIRTDVSPNRRMEITSNGWQSYDASNTLWAELNLATSSMLVTGTIRTGLTGARINLLPDGTARYYQSSGTAFSEIKNNGLAGLRFRGPAASDSTDVGYLYLAADNATIAWGRDSAPTSSNPRTRVDSDGMQTFGKLIGLRQLTTEGAGSVFFAHQNSSFVDISDSVLHYLYKSSTSFTPCWGAPSQGAGLVFGDQLYVTNGSGDTGSSRPIVASAFTLSSALARKTGVEVAFRAEMPAAADVVRLAPIRSYWLRSELATRPDKPGFQVQDATGAWVDGEWARPQPPARPRLGPLADELVTVHPSLVVNPEADPADRRVDLLTIASVAWAAGAESHDRLDGHERRLARLERMLSPEVVDGEVA